ncbi:NrfD/PsrC family molybdoenzyme membrane anchor subunit [Blastococcus sp. PRF04-17]|uniref:NrfD/PsrC family molybdoenzyme membrane anchor subunit n=1 Tax=Blastococcus sp. PRF04-17 TaxID=2933797 RepID=UPI001FF1CE09|nr:NrfD/PsrC family molybdoenzyme membrane anchor subunit [Blastococcus sp. PRF04-17]UOY00228.1 polysulfide reductase NrfD [Blastococcus sp. PRF04-17]
MTGGITSPEAGWRQADRGPATQRTGKRRRRGGGRGRGEVPMVDDVEFTSYYGRQIVKTPVWKSPDVPLYLFLGGAAGSSSILAALADVTGRPKLTKVARLTSAGGAMASVVFLVHDLGRPERFLHMLRVFKPTSPLSVGTYILSPFSAAAGATAAVELLGWFPRLKRFGEWWRRCSAGRWPPTPVCCWPTPRCRRGTSSTASCRTCSAHRRWPPGAASAWR